MADIGLPTFDLTEKDPSARLRGAALWILGAFVAVGSAQIVSVSLDGFEKTASNPEAVTMAVVGYCAMIIGLTIGIMSTGSLLVPVSYSTHSNLASDQKLYGNEDYFIFFGSLGTLNVFLDKYSQLRLTLAKMSDGPDKDKLLQISQKYKEGLDRWIEYRKLEILGENYRKAVPGIFVGMFITFGGIAIFNLAPTLVPNDALRTQITKLNELKTKLEADQKALDRESKEADQLKSQWKQATAGQDAAALLENRAKVLDEREKALDTLAAQLNTSALTSMSFASQPLAGTWTPKKAYSNCAPTINVTVLRLWKDEDIMKAQIFASSPTSVNKSTDKGQTSMSPPDDSKKSNDVDSNCASFVKTVTKDDGTLTVQSQEWTLN